MTQGNFGDASPYLLLEINSFATPVPFLKKSIQTYIGGYLKNTDRDKLITKYHLESFEINVLDIRRTFVEKKIAAIARASFESPQNHDQLRRKIRHLYDITLLAKLPGINTFLESTEFGIWLAAVKNDDAQVSIGQRELANRSLAEAPIFKETKKTCQELRSTYEKQFSSMVYDAEKMPGIDEVENTVVKIKSIF